MQTATQTATSAAPASKAILWAAYGISALAVLFLIFDSVIKVLKLAPAVEATTQLGYPESLVIIIGVIELACLAVYVIPRTAILGAILMTGYLGGAIATNLRAGTPLFNVVFPIIIGALLWGGIYLRDQRLRALIPLRK
jgi:hypothetical protein